MLELDATIMTPAPVFETLGHVACFADWMVKDIKTREVLRADRLVEGMLEASRKVIRRLAEHWMYLRLLMKWKRRLKVLLLSLMMLLSGSMEMY